MKGFVKTFLELFAERSIWEEFSKDLLIFRRTVA